ncbi:hypothetical protein C7I87_32350 [Mesorhizobium sp. SARCC-RB16n]|nr:hypothetical protein C7I87_32350 [Mesorhizobium sp. SARCC-RB16n]
MEVRIQELTTFLERATAAIESRFMKLSIMVEHQSIGREFIATSYITSCAPDGQVHRRSPLMAMSTSEVTRRCAICRLRAPFRTYWYIS